MYKVKFMENVRYGKYHERRKNKDICIAVGIFCFTVLIIFIVCKMLVSGKYYDEEAYLYKYYTSIEVKKGDTLWDIASTYTVNAKHISKKKYIEEVQSMNGLTDDIIYEGAYLTIPYYSSTLK